MADNTRFINMSDWEGIDTARIQDVMDNDPTVTDAERDVYQRVIGMRTSAPAMAPQQQEQPQPQQTGQPNEVLQTADNFAGGFNDSIIRGALMMSADVLPAARNAAAFVANQIPGVDIGRMKLPSEYIMPEVNKAGIGTYDPDATESYLGIGMGGAATGAAMIPRTLAASAGAGARGAFTPALAREGMAGVGSGLGMSAAHDIAPNSNLAMIAGALGGSVAGSATTAATGFVPKVGAAIREEARSQNPIQSGRIDAAERLGMSLTPGQISRGSILESAWSQAPGGYSQTVRNVKQQGNALNNALAAEAHNLGSGGRLSPGAALLEGTEQAASKWRGARGAEYDQFFADVPGSTPTTMKAAGAKMEQIAPDYPVVRNLIPPALKRVRADIDEINSPGPAPTSVILDANGSPIVTGPPTQAGIPLQNVRDIRSNIHREVHLQVAS